MGFARCTQKLTVGSKLETQGELRELSCGKKSEGKMGAKVQRRETGAFNEPQMFSMEGVLMKLVGDEAGEMENDLNFILSDSSSILKRVAIKAT